MTGSDERLARLEAALDAQQRQIDQLRAENASKEDVSLALYDTRDNAYKTTHFVEVDPDEVEPPIERRSPVYGTTFPGYWILLSPTNGGDVSLEGAITSAGKVPYR